MSNHEKTLNAFISLLALEKGFNSSHTQSFSHPDRSSAAKSAHSSWALNGFLKSFGSEGNVQLRMPSLSVIPPCDESNVQGDDLKTLTNSIVKTRQPRKDTDPVQNAGTGYTKAQMLQNFSRTIVFSSSERKSSADATLYSDILTTPDVLNENLTKSIRYLLDSRLKYFIATLVLKPFRSKSMISKSVASLLSLQATNKAPTELDDQNLIKPVIDVWESPSKQSIQKQISTNHHHVDGQSSSFPTVKRKYNDPDTQVEYGKGTNDNDFPFDINERVRRFTARIASCSISFEIQKGGSHSLQSNKDSISSTEATSSTSISASNATLVCLPIMLVAKATVDVSIKHFLKVNIALRTIGTIQGKFNGDLLEEIEIFLDTEALYDNITNQVKLAIKKAVILLLNTTPTVSKSVLLSAQKSSKAKSANIWNHEQAPSCSHDGQSKRSVPLPMNPRVANMNQTSFIPDKKSSASALQHSNIHRSLHYTHRPLINSRFNYIQNNPNRYNRDDSYQFNCNAPNGFVVEQARNNHSLHEAYLSGYGNGYNYQSNIPAIQQPNPYGGFNTRYSSDYSRTHMPYSFGGDPRSFPSSMHFLDIHMADRNNNVDFSVQNAAGLPMTMAAYRPSQSDMINAPIADRVTQGPTNAIFNAPQFAIQTDAGRPFTYPDSSDADNRIFARPEPVMRRNSMMSRPFIPPNAVHRMQAGNLDQSDPQCNRASKMSSNINTSPLNHQQRMPNLRYSGTSIPAILSADKASWMEENEHVNNEQYNQVICRMDADLPLSSESAHEVRYHTHFNAPKDEGDMDPCIPPQEAEITQNGEHKYFNVAEKSPKRRRSSFPIESVLAAVNLARISEQDESFRNKVSEESTLSDVKRRRSSNAAYAAIVRFLEEEEKSKGGDSEISIDTVTELSRLTEIEETLRRSSVPAMLSAAETVRRWEIENCIDRRESEVSTNAALEATRFVTSEESKRRSLGPQGFIDHAQNATA